MLKNILYLFLPLALAAGCSKSEDNDVHPTEYMPDWMEVKAQWGGKWNAARYPVYDKYQTTLLANDSLGTVDLRPNAFGDVVKHTEYFDLNYNVFSEITTNAVTVTYASDPDSTGLLLAAEIIEKYAMPNAPKAALYRPSGILLADEMTVRITWDNTGIFTKELTTFPNSMRGVGAAKVRELEDMTETQQKLWAGRIISPKSAKWIIENDLAAVDLQAFMGVTGDFYYKIYTFTNANGKKTPQDLGGFLEWYFDGEGTAPNGNAVSRRISPNIEEDVRAYVAAVYAFRDDLDAFTEYFGTHNGTAVTDTSKIVSKYKLMLQLVTLMEKELNS